MPGLTASPRGMVFRRSGFISGAGFLREIPACRMSRACPCCSCPGRAPPSHEVEQSQSANPVKRDHSGETTRKRADTENGKCLRELGLHWGSANRWITRRARCAESHSRALRARLPLVNTQLPVAHGCIMAWKNGDAEARSGRQDTTYTASQGDVADRPKGKVVVLNPTKKRPRGCDAFFRMRDR